MADESGYPLYPPTKLDQTQIFQGSYDETTQRLRVESVASVSNVDFNVDLDPSEDGVFVADKDTGATLVINPDGSINAVTGAGGANTPTIQNLTLPSANTEYAIVFPIGTKKMSMKVRDCAAPLQLSWNLGESNTNYLSIPRGCNYSENDLNLTTLFRTVYVRTNKSNMILECISWE